ncbi:MAG: DUF5681 domain-containing protein [Pseudomonadota bacterium]
METRFKRGVSGNPRGRPKGAKNKMPALKRVSGLLCTGLPVHAEKKGQRGPWRRRSTRACWTSC